MVWDLAFLLRQPLPQAVPWQRLWSSFSAQDGESWGAPMARRRTPPLTLQLAQQELPGGFKASEVRLEACPSPLAWHSHRMRVLLELGEFLLRRTFQLEGNYRSSFAP